MMRQATWQQQPLTDKQFIELAENEPERLRFWSQYYHDNYLKACKTTCNNSPEMDRMFYRAFPTVETYKRFKDEIDAENH